MANGERCDRPKTVSDEAIEALILCEPRDLAVVCAANGVSRGYAERCRAGTVKRALYARVRLGLDQRLSRRAYRAPASCEP